MENEDEIKNHVEDHFQALFQDNIVKTESGWFVFTSAGGRPSKMAGEAIRGK